MDERFDEIIDGKFYFMYDDADDDDDDDSTIKLWSFSRNFIFYIFFVGCSWLLSIKK